MLSILARFLSAIFFLWIFRRLLGLFLGGSKASRPKGPPAESSNHMVKDPVCGMYMDSRLAIRLENKREEFYFCSEDCRNKYLNQASGASSSAPPG